MAEKAMGVNSGSVFNIRNLPSSTSRLIFVGILFMIEMTKLLDAVGTAVMT